MFGIVELLKLKGLDTSSKTKNIKIVRHQHKDIHELYRKGHIELYQSYQSKPVFDRCDFIVACIALEKSKARFIGVYRVNGKKSSDDVPLPDNHPYPDIAPDDWEGYFYELEEVDGYEDFIDRVVIDWGKATVAWHQWLWLTDKEIVEILPSGYVKAFPGYLDFVLRYDELVDIINNPASNREWHTMLSSVAGIYLITDTRTGKQYVGSAYGKKGMLGRWAAYVNNPDGGNKKLNALLAENHDYAENFQYTILRTLPRTLTLQEIIAYEEFFKRKLGTKAFGLNS